MAAVQAIGAREARTTCRICGQPALPAVRLCAQCKAALKRVRYDTVSQQMPMPRRSRGGERSRAPARTGDDVETGAPRHNGAVSLRGMRIPLVLVAMAAIVGSGGYFIVRQIHAATPPESIAASGASAVERSADTARSPAPASPAGVQASSAIPATVSQAVDMAESREDAKLVVARPRSVARSVKAPVLAVGPPVPEPSPEPPPAPVVVAVAPPAPRPPDRMQLLAQAFAQCPQDSLLPQMICEQKARIQYCDGYWGRTSLCPNGVPEGNYNSH
jgi:hypothetical protein